MGKWKWSWTILGLVALGVRWIAAYFPEATDKLYARSIFPIIRIIIDETLGKLPFPSVYFFILSVFVLLTLFFRRVKKKTGFRDRAFFTIRSLCNALGALVFFFLVLWGFNYQRTPIIKQLSLDPKSLELEEIESELMITEKLMLQARSEITTDTLPIEKTISYPSLEGLVRNSMSENLDLLGLDFTGEPRTKMFPPPGFMRKMGILGIYFPYTGESYIDPTLHPLEQPFTVAHEMAHSVGVTNEGEANFIAWVVCNYSEDPLLIYSSNLRLLLYQMRDYYKMAPEKYKEWVKILAPGIKNDIRSIQEQNSKYKAFSIELSQKTNDFFLKSQGVKAGIQSYQQLPKLAFAWRDRMGDF